LELCGREVARRSLLHGLVGWQPGLLTLVVIAFVAALPVVLRMRERTSPALVVAVLFTVGVALQITLGARLQSDGFYYYAYLRSLAFDRDVDFTNDYRLLGLGDKTYLFQPTRTGHAHSAWTIGPAIVWAPFFGAGHLVAERLRASGADVAVDGTSYPYRQAICIASLFYGLLGCWFCYRLTRRTAPAAVAAAAVTLAVTGSFMLWYLVKEPSMTHATSMAAVAAFVWIWAATREQRTPGQWAALGLLAGVMALIRWQNILFAILPGWDALVALTASLRTRDTVRTRATLIASATFLVCALAGFLPQMLAWKAIYGSWIARSPVGPQIRWFDPHVTDILWSARNGLLSTSPILYAAALGLIGVAVAQPAFGVPIVLAAAVMTYFNACIQDWWGSAGFGGRRFDGLIPLFVVGLGWFIMQAAALVRRHAVLAVSGAGILLALWNLTLMGAAQSGAVRIGETLSFDRAWAAQARVFHDWFGNPFSYPASLLFALRNRVPPGDYDLLGTNRFLADPLQPYGRVDVGADDQWLIGEGWHEPEREGATTFRWAATPATLRLPLDHVATLRIQIRLHAFGFAGAPPQTLTIATERAACAPLPIETSWQTVECVLDANAWRAGVTTLTLRFAWARRPADVGLGGDQRELAAAVDYVRVQK
jgi:hypothetical protein